MQRREFFLLASFPLLPAADFGPALRFLAQNRYYARVGKAKEVFDLRMHASDVLDRIGVSSGRVFRGRGGDEPDAVWQAESLTREAMREARRKVLMDPEFMRVEERMGTLISRFEASVYQEVIPTIVDDKRASSSASSPSNSYFLL